MVGSLSSARGAAGKRKKECGQEFAIHKTTFFPLTFPGPRSSPRPRPTAIVFIITSAPASATRCSRCRSKILLSITNALTFSPPLDMLLPPGEKIWAPLIFWYTHAPGSIPHTSKVLLLIRPV